MSTLAVFAGNFNPPGLHHRRIVEELRKQFDSVVVVPCGPRTDRPIDVEPVYRAAMSDLAFGGLDRVEVDLFDLEQARFTPAYDLERRYAGRGEVWHVVGLDLVLGGRAGGSAIHQRWQHGAELWQRHRFAVVYRQGHTWSPDDLPPCSRIIDCDYEVSGTVLRDRLFHGEPVTDLMPPGVVDYIRRHGLYRSGPRARTTLECTLAEPRLIVAAADRNPTAQEWAASFARYECPENPNCVLVIGGDGTMLRAIQRYWRLRVPFFGLNAGHLGFLLNDPEEVLSGAFPPPALISRPMPLLYVQMQTQDGEWVNGLTFNDTWVERATGQTAWVEVNVDGVTRLPKLVCDGVLLSTAAGSTAYARSMGATPLLPDTPAWLIVGSNVMHPINFKSALLSLDAQVELRNLDPGKRPLNGYVSGDLVRDVLAVRARVSRIAAAELVFCPQHDMTQKIAQIQFPAGWDRFAGP